MAFYFVKSGSTKKTSDGSDMEETRKLVYLVRTQDMMEREKAVFSTEALAQQFIKVQALQEAEIEELQDLTRSGLVPLTPTKVYLQEEPDPGFQIEGVLDEDCTPEGGSTTWYEPLVPENSRGLGLYHAWIRNSEMAEPCLSFGCAGCTCQFTAAETPVLRKDGEQKGVFHCFAKSQKEASRVAHVMMTKYWRELPVDTVTDWNGRREVIREAVVN